MPDDWPYEDARDLFLNPDVRPGEDPAFEFNWQPPDVEKLVGFLVGEKGFNEDRVRGAAARLQKSAKTAMQSRLEGFFKPVARTEEEKAGIKRKNEARAEAAKKKKREDSKTKRGGKK